MTYEPGEGPPDPEAKAKAATILGDPAHQKPVGSEEDLATVDGELNPPLEDAGQTPDDSIEEGEPE